MPTATAYSCRTNLPPIRPSGFWRPQGHVVIEAAIHKAAETIGVPATVIQQRTSLPPASSFHMARWRSVNCTLLEKAVDSYDAGAMIREVEQFNSENRLKKKGCLSCLYVLAFHLPKHR